MKDFGSEKKVNSEKCIYLDYNSTTPVTSKVVEAMIPYFNEHFGNPSSAHIYSTIPREAIHTARKSIILLFQPNNDKSIVFTGCGTEADNLAISLVIFSSSFSNISENREIMNKPHIVTSNVEHPAIIEYLKVLKNRSEVYSTTQSFENNPH